MKILSGTLLRAIKVCTGTQLRILLTVAHLEEAKINDISKVSGVTKDNVRKAVRELDGLELVWIDRNGNKIENVYIKED